MTEASILSDKLRRYGTLGAGIIPDALATIRFLEATKAKAKASRAQKAPKASPSKAPAPASGSRTWKKPSGRGPLTRQEVSELLDETIRVQGIVQIEISQLARDLAKESAGVRCAQLISEHLRATSMQERSDKKKKKSLSIPEAYQRIKELKLPIDPLEELDLSEQAFQKLISQYENDEEVSVKAQLLLHPEPKGDTVRARSISVEKIIEIHQFMVVRMQKVLTEFLTLDQETRRSFSNKACETTAELLVSIAVEQQGVHCEDVEQAGLHENVLANHPEFARCTEQLANMMQHLTGSAQPRAEKADFLEVLRNMANHAQASKEFSKKVYEDYRAKSCNAGQAYRRFEDFNAAQPVLKEGLEDLTPVELQLCYDEYREDPEVQQAWNKAGVENSLNLASSLSLKPGASPEDKKGKKIKPSEIVEMQELMVDEMKRLCEASREAAKASQKPWQADTAMQMVQALASAAVERRYGASPEEVTMAGLQNAPTLQKNERFVRATEKQQEIIMTVASFCSQSQ
ncbi:unnamed protein product [Effrenium voratum]|nr:unnamed protein product [Effrenium voratum]CAJ1444314.1 unnamed protein product [Effrenium voratum]